MIYNKKKIYVYKSKSGNFIINCNDKFYTITDDNFIQSAYIKYLPEMGQEILKQENLPIHIIPILNKIMEIVK